MCVAKVRLFYVCCCYSEIVLCVVLLKCDDVMCVATVRSFYVCC